MPQEHIGRDYRKKLNDIVWKVDLRGNPCYIMREVNAMLLENAPNWKYEYIAIGREEALETTRGDLREMLFSMIHEKFGASTTKIHDKLSDISDIKDLCGLAKNIPSIDSAARLNEIMDDIISRKHGKQ